MEQLKKSKGSEHMRKITEQYNKYSAAVRVTLTYKERLKKLVDTFPKKVTRIARRNVNKV